MSLPRICLNMIVKNEADRIQRCLDSTVGHINRVVVLDTGSTDNTPEIIVNHCVKHGISWIIATDKFENFQQARNLALKHARDAYKACPDFDYILLMDADMELRVEAPLPPLIREAYAIVQRQGNLAYHNTRLLHATSTAEYHGVTHEYIGADNYAVLPEATCWFLDHADGANRGDKIERDIRLLTTYLETHPDDARSLFYLAQTYKDAGQLDMAIEYYQKRIIAGGWDEEVWYSRLALARCYREKGDEPAFILAALNAYNSRPSRAEPLYDLAKHFRLKPDAQRTAWLFAEAGEKIPPTGDMLFVEKNVYDFGFTEELSILGAYNDKTRAIGAAAANKLSLMKEAPETIREGARRNLFWYLDRLVADAPSFRVIRIPEVNADPTFVNTNPSIMFKDGLLDGIVRTVSYRIRPDGTYDYNGHDAINTTNFYVKFHDDGTFAFATQILRPLDFPPPQSTEIRGIEDMRLFSYKGELWANGCVLEQNKDYWREQYLMKINPYTGETTDWRRIDPKFIPKQHEKNWMPIISSVGPMKWMYRPGCVMDGDGELVIQHENALAVDQFAGGGQVIMVDGGWLAIIHEARPHPQNGKRFYQHRFVWYGPDWKLMRVSKPFVFFDRQIEFASGLATDWHKDMLYVSFGVNDCEAWIGTLDMNDVRGMLWID
jgi:glycosyltransferase involved in cell wall biosynthesis